MGKFIEQLPTDFQDYLEQEKFTIETIHGGDLHMIYNPIFNLKVYDCIGHGFGVNVNICSNFDTSIYEGDETSISWVFKYYELQEQTNFSTRTEEGYLENLPLLYSDLQLIITQLLKIGVSFWNEPIKRIQQLAKEHFG